MTNAQSRNTSRVHCEFGDEDVHMHAVSSLVQSRRFKEQTSLEYYGAWLVTSRNYAGLMFTNEVLPNDAGEYAYLGKVASDMRLNAEGDMECGEWIDLLSNLGAGEISVSGGLAGSYAMDLDSAVTQFIEHGNFDKPDSSVEWSLL